MPAPAPSSVLVHPHTAAVLQGLRPGAGSTAGWQREPAAPPAAPSRVPAPFSYPGCQRAARSTRAGQGLGQPAESTHGPLGADARHRKALREQLGTRIPLHLTGPPRPALPGASSGRDKAPSSRGCSAGSRLRARQGHRSPRGPGQERGRAPKGTNRWRRGRAGPGRAGQRGAGRAGALPGRGAAGQAAAGPR